MPRCYNHRLPRIGSVSGMLRILQVRDSFNLVEKTHDFLQLRFYDLLLERFFGKTIVEKKKVKNEKRNFPSLLLFRALNEIYDKSSVNACLVRCSIFLIPLIPLTLNPPPLISPCFASCFLPLSREGCGGPWFVELILAKSEFFMCSFMKLNNENLLQLRTNYFMKNMLRILQVRAPFNFVGRTHKFPPLRFTDRKIFREKKCWKKRRRRSIGRERYECGGSGDCEIKNGMKRILCVHWDPVQRVVRVELVVKSLSRKLSRAARTARTRR